MSKNSAPSQEDLRVRRTHKLLWEALVTLLEKRSLEEISVKDICERAMVHRTTFYKHFTDKYDLLANGAKNIAEALTGHEQFSEEYTRKPYIAALTHALDYIASHQQLFTLLLVEQKTNSLATLIRQQLAERMETSVKLGEEKGMRFLVPPPLMAQFCAGAALAVATWWLENKMEMPIEELAHHLYRLFEDGENGAVVTKEYKRPG